MELPYGITLPVGSSLGNRTGAWRVERPVYADGRAPCGHACPAHEDPQDWLYAAEEGDYRTAWTRLVAANPFPAVMGRVCYHPCETACNRGRLDEAVGINAVERFLGDHALTHGWDLPGPGPATGRHVLVVGAGPTGLTAAYQLRRLGHEVTVRDAGHEPGGMMRYGIPTYRLPRDVLDAEIARIVRLGVGLEQDSQVTDLDAALEEGFDATLLAVGAQLGHRAYVPAGEAARVLDAVTLLHDVAEGAAPRIGRRVVVYGGGSTAVDAARTVRRLGAEESVIVYRRDRAHMPAHPAELAEALDEGVVVRWLTTVARAEPGRLAVERMELDEAGFPQPTGEIEELSADALVLAVGQDCDLAFLDGVAGVEVRDGVVQVDEFLRTGRAGVFAGGDTVPGQRSVTAAIGHGTRVARFIDAWLRGREPTVAAELPVVDFEQLNPWYFADAPHAVRPRLEAARRVTGFEEVVQGLDETTALYEARRCMSCGSCFECDNCYGVCPDDAVVKLGPGLRFEIDYDYCKGCGLCAAECPAGAILMVPEPVPPS
ncbi:NAD(P)-binding protein [Cellulomonas sp. APG4]|uniref:NAD(P)-binding protein n=1 Tax=Cellulomonas sp. APG4 TaxID=1538656 RepID=UPI00192A2289|nr:NAD(P)-binding protein [Cellulomonas sp. APG4]